MKYYLIAGEASGDLHASNLMKELKIMDKGAEFRFLGGGLMAAQGGKPVKHYREMAFMGFIPVILNAKTILKNLETCKSDISRFQPDVVILIDYPGFNLKIARYVKTKLHIPVYYYISPKTWAWKKYRIKEFRRYVDRMFCILPFEVSFYEQFNYQVDYVGNPSVDSVSQYKEEHPGDASLLLNKEKVPAGKPVLALLAGSRKQEIKDNLPVMLDVASSFPEYYPVIAGAPGIDPSHYDQFTTGREATVIFGQTYSLLQYSHAALVTSGTATLETALFRTPQVVCYYTAAGRITGFIFRHFFTVPYISLVNLIAGKEVVKELFADKFSFRSIREELDRILHDESYRKRMMDGYDEIIELLGQPGASERTAKLIYNSLKS